jgi:hypothetical protein
VCRGSPDDPARSEQLARGQCLRHPATLADGLPVEFSWPIRPSTLDPTDFRITFNTGPTVVPELASIHPNTEYNERSVAVLFGTFGNRLPSGAPGDRIAGHGLRILGLADLGPKQQQYDDCYREDKDNYIDIVIAGEEAAVRRITGVEIPASGDYSPFHNPGGPGENPTPGVPYSSPGPSRLEPVWVALGDPMTVTFVRAQP